MAGYNMRILDVVDTQTGRQRHRLRVQASTLMKTILSQRELPCLEPGETLKC